MSTIEIKKNLVQYIEQADDRILKAVYALLQNYMAEEESIVGFTVEGTPLTKKDLTELVDNSVREIEEGKGLTSDDIRKAKKNW